MCTTGWLGTICENVGHSCDTTEPACFLVSRKVVSLSKSAICLQKALKQLKMATKCCVLARSSRRPQTKIGLDLGVWLKIKFNSETT